MVEMRRKLGAPSASTNLAGDAADAAVPSHRSTPSTTCSTGSVRNHWQPLPVEATILAGIAFYAVIESADPNPAPEQSSFREDEKGSTTDYRIPFPTALTAISSLISCGAVWSQCFSAVTTGKKGEVEGGRKGADPAGLSIGSTLVPLLFCSAMYCTDSSVGYSLEAYAIASSVTGLTVSLRSLSWSRSSAGGGTSHYGSAVARTSAYILLAFVISLAAANSSSIEVSPTLLSDIDAQILTLTTIGVHGILLYYYSRAEKSGVCAAFSPGEWCCVSNLLAILVVDFANRYCLSTSVETDTHIAIAHGGLVGCTVGCALAALVPHHASDRTRSIVLQYVVELCIVVGTTITCVEFAAWPLLQKEDDESSLAHIPLSLLWLAKFLLAPEDTSSKQEGDDCLVTKLANLPRWGFLVYWVIVLLVAAVPAGWMASFLLELPMSSRKHRLVVVSRKYFHLVAVLLFLPPTLLAPSMIVLSYAVALCVLLLVETLRRMVRPQVIQRSQSSLNNFYQAFLDEKDVSRNKSMRKPSRGKQSGIFVVTHIAMIFGCALPLWVKEALFSSSLEPRYSPLSVSLLPLIGILALGVGDAAGAVVGVYCGRHKWPGTRRTIEGSIAMFVSMYSFLLVILYYTPNLSLSGSTLRDSVLAWRTFGPSLLILTLLEAFTCQIDNLCLPLVGTSLWLLLHSG